MWVNKSTLAYQLGSRPGTMMIDNSKAKLQAVAKQVLAYKKKAALVHPETEAIWFYLQNHATALVRLRKGMNDPLGEYTPIVSDYQDRLSDSATRMFCYLLLICVRESRHRHTSNNKSYESMLKAKYGNHVLMVSLEIGDTSNAAEMLASNSPDVELGLFTTYLEEQFFGGSYSGGYGGPKWGEVARVLNNYVHGKFSAEMMMDTSFTLAHNNGPIFNKSMLYNMYAMGPLMQILDAQAAGKIPQYVANSVSMTSAEMREWQKKAESLLGHEFGGEYDQTKIPAGGANKIGKKYKGSAPSVKKVLDGDYLMLAPNFMVKKSKREAESVS